MNIFSENFEGYGGKYFFIPYMKTEVEVMASEKLSRELKAKDAKAARAEAKKYGHGSVTIEIAEV